MLPELEAGGWLWKLRQRLLDLVDRMLTVLAEAERRRRRGDPIRAAHQHDRLPHLEAAGEHASEEGGAALECSSSIGWEEEPPLVEPPVPLSEPAVFL